MYYKLLACTIKNNAIQCKKLYINRLNRHIKTINQLRDKNYKNLNILNINGLLKVYRELPMLLTITQNAQNTDEVLPTETSNIFLNITKIINYVINNNYSHIIHIAQKLLRIGHSLYPQSHRISIKKFIDKNQ